MADITGFASVFIAFTSLIVAALHLLAFVYFSSRKKK